MTNKPLDLDALEKKYSGPNWQGTDTRLLIAELRAARSENEDIRLLNDGVCRAANIAETKCYVLQQQIEDARDMCARPEGTCLPARERRP